MTRLMFIILACTLLQGELALSQIDIRVKCDQETIFIHNRMNGEIVLTSVTSHWQGVDEGIGYGSWTQPDIEVELRADEYRRFNCELPAADEEIAGDSNCPHRIDVSVRYVDIQNPGPLTFSRLTYDHHLVFERDENGRYKLNEDQSEMPLPSISVEHGKPQVSQEIEIVCHFGVGGKNQLDTRAGTFTHDLPREPDTTIQLNLTQAEKRAVLSYADSIGFFDYPHELKAVPILVDSTYDLYRTYDIHPCGHTMLLISAGDRQNTVKWDNCTEPQDKRHKPLDDLVNVIIHMVMSKSAYKALPSAASYQ